MDKIIIKNIDNSKFKELQQFLFNNDCYWYKYSQTYSQEYRTYQLTDYEYICICDNLITLITEKDVSKHIYNEYKIFYNVNAFLRTYKINKIYG